MKNLLSSTTYRNKTPLYHFELGDRFHLRDREYGFLRTTAEGCVFERVDAVGHELELTHSEVSTLLNSGQLVLPWDRKSEA